MVLPELLLSEANADLASAGYFGSANEPLSPTLVQVEEAMAVNITSACITAQEAVKGFAGLPETTLKTFIYTGNKTIVTCFYCNGSLQNWGANDNPTIEHARWFPHCAYAKQLWWL